MTERKNKPRPKRAQKEKTNHPERIDKAREIYAARSRPSPPMAVGCTQIRWPSQLRRLDKGFIIVSPLIMWKNRGNATVRIDY